MISLPSATRESAFVHAIASAGVAFAVTRSCAEGSATICGCDTRHKGPPGEGWKWGGCSEDADFGSMVSREFADARENRPDARSAMNRHNNEAGRTVRKTDCIFLLHSLSAASVLEAGQIVLCPIAKNIVRVQPSVEEGSEALCSWVLQFLLLYLSKQMSQTFRLQKKKRGGRKLAHMLYTVKVANVSLPFLYLAYRQADQN